MRALRHRKGWKYLVAKSIFGTTRWDPARWDRAEVNTGPAGLAKPWAKQQVEAAATTAAEASPAPSSPANGRPGNGRLRDGIPERPARRRSPTSPSPEIRLSLFEVVCTGVLGFSGICVAAGGDPPEIAAPERCWAGRSPMLPGGISRSVWRLYVR
ncbi:hypothetical protein ACIBHX_20690 [Nonomuraea sp. NPDC050536]|uniref:hypothetical protein n=1 Tax=Nonomuraea sp. NPDC050536 TaxID=3364366 RepID=UPI0037CA293C